MPIYEYQCKNCGKRFEKMQPITAEPLTECVHCGQGPIRRVFQPVGVIFKGSGWYITDSRKQPKSEAKSEGDSKPAAETKSEPSSSSDSKSEPAKPTDSSTG